MKKAFKMIYCAIGALLAVAVAIALAYGFAATGEPLLAVMATIAALAVMLFACWAFEDTSLPDKFCRFVDEEGGRR